MMKKPLLAAMLCALMAVLPASAQTYKDNLGTIVPGVVPIPATVGGTASLAVTNASGTVAIPASDSLYPSINLTNSGSVALFYALGPTATTSSAYLGPGSSACIAAGSATTVAAITASSTTTLQLAQTNSCIYAQNGSTSGGGGGAVSGVTAADTTLTISPTTGAVVAGINLANQNTWSGVTIFQDSVSGAATGAGLIISPLWNTSGVVDAALLINPSNSGSGAGSLLIDAKLTGVSQFSVSKTGIITTASVTGSTQCLHANTSGVISGTGSDCGSGGGGGLTVGATTITSGTSGDFEFNNAGVLGEVAPTGTGSVVLATSPTLVTPALGAATGTSLALNGQSLSANEIAALRYSPGANTLTPGLGVVNANAASTGNQQPACLVLSGQGWKTNATAASEEVADMLCASPVQGTAGPTGGFELLHEINGVAFARILDYNFTASSTLSIAVTTSISGNLNVPSGQISTGSLYTTSNTTASYNINNDTFLTRHAAANWQVGAADAAAPVAQTLGVQSVVAGTTNTNGANWTINGSTSTGSGTAGDIILQTGGTGAGATAQNSQVAALTIKGATQLVQINAIASDATHTDATVCEDTTSHALYSGSGTAGICLGTSSARFKHDITALDAGLPQIMALQPRRYFLNPGHGDTQKPYYGFLAEDGASALPELVGYDEDGRPNTFDYLGIVPVLVRAVQEQQAEIAALREQTRASAQ